MFKSSHKEGVDKALRACVKLPCSRSLSEWIWARTRWRAMSTVHFGFVCPVIFRDRIDMPVTVEVTTPAQFDWWAPCCWCP